MGDVMDIARGLLIPAFGQPANTLTKAVKSNTGIDAEYYLRFSLVDEAGVMAAVSATLGEHGVSINRMHQYDHEGDAAPVIIVTHKVSRVKLDGALDEIAAMDTSLEKPIAIRIETV